MSPKNLYAALSSLCAILSTVAETERAPVGAISLALELQGATPAQMNDLLSVLVSNGWLTLLSPGEVRITAAGRAQLEKLQAKRRLAAMSAGIIAPPAGGTA